MCTNDNLRTTRSIITDYFNWRLKHIPVRHSNRLFFIVQKIASDCERTYHSEELKFNFHFSSLSLIELENIYYEIAKELFSDEIITWTRIIALIAFSALLTECLIQEQQNMDLIFSSMIDWTTNFININLHAWLESQNYWDGCLKVYDRTPQRRNSIGRYASIFGTLGMLTLGALYMKRI